MIVQPKPWPPVPGTRKRGGAKNLPVKKITKIQNINNKKKRTIATWNVRTMNDDGKLDQLLNEMTRFKIDILGASETHWTTDTQEAFEHQNFVILQAGRNDGLHRQGVALIINREFSKSMTSYQAI